MIGSNLKRFATAILLVVSTQAIAKDSFDLNQHPDTRKSLQIYDYQLVKTLGFSDLGDNTAYTFLYRNKDDKNPRSYYVNASPTKEGPVLMFRVGEACIKGTFNGNAVIEINESNIQVASLCSVDASNELGMSYKIKTSEGLAFAADQFLNKSVVVVRFRSMKIPFETTEFSEAWRKANVKPL